MVGLRPQDRGDLQSEWVALAVELRGTGREACPKATTVTQAREDGGSDPAEGRQVVRRGCCPGFYKNRAKEVS